MKEPEVIKVHHPIEICQRDGYFYYYIRGTNKIHCDDGPAVIFEDGFKAWYQHGELHRVDGPAVENADGTKKWFLWGIELANNGAHAKMLHKFAKEIDNHE